MAARPSTVRSRHKPGLTRIARDRSCGNLSNPPGCAIRCNEGLRQNWLPEQISMRLRVDHPTTRPGAARLARNYVRMLVPASTRRVRTELTIALRQGRTHRVNRSRATATRGTIRDMTNIWEGDMGPRQGMARHADFTIKTGMPSTSPTRTHRGNAAATRTPTDSSASTSPRAPAFP